MTRNLSERSWSNVARIVAVLGIVALALGMQEPGPKAPDPAKSDPVEAELVEAHNKERAAEDLPPLKLEAKLSEAALAHAKDMAAREVMTHEGADGSTPLQRIVRVGYHLLGMSENVAQGYRTVPEVMQGWMDSPPHKKNVMGDFSEIGVARVEGKDGKPYWAAEFGKPMPKLDPAEAATSLVKRLNEERSAAKLPDLAVDPRLAKAAEAVASDLAQNKGKATSPSAFGKIDQKAFRDLAMTTSAGQPDAEALVKSLMENPDYKAQLLGKYSKVGAGYATAEDGIPHWSLILGSPARR